jgi:hypothetical protein
MSNKLSKKEKKEKTFLYGVLENIPGIDANKFKEKVCEVLIWTDKQWGHRLYPITPITNAEISLVTRLYLAYRENKINFFASSISDYDYQSVYTQQL